MATTYSEVITTVKLIIEALTPTTTYLRAQNISEANYTIPKTDLALNPAIGIHINLPVIENPLSTPQQGKFLGQWPLEVLFLQTVSLDPNAGEIDTALNTTKALLDQFIDRLAKSSIITLERSVLNYTSNAVDTTQDRKWSDDVLAGWILTVTVPIQRDYCIWDSLFQLYAAFILEDARFTEALPPTNYVVETGWEMFRAAIGSSQITRPDTTPNVAIGDTVTAVMDFDVITVGNVADLVRFLYADIIEAVAIGSVGAGNSGQISVTQVVAAVTIPDFTITFQTIAATQSEVVITKLVVTVTKP